MTTYKALEIVTESGYFVWLDTDPQLVSNLIEDLNPEHVTSIGTVVAPNIDDAIKLIRRGDWIRTTNQFDAYYNNPHSDLPMVYLLWVEDGCPFNGDYADIGEARGKTIPSYV